MNTFEQSIIEAAQAATPNNTDAEREAARVAATQAVADIMASRSGLDRTLALAELLDSYSEHDEQDED
ncbi:hypothetical protein BTW15_24635 [Pseudomonas syringae pv. tomato]|jgi:hypothetical protein|uniref:Uncharacterized protein n=21 Tax=Pseudomonas syringae group TaxID=136849 RepID=A0AAW4DWU5_PSESX|nr:MULTISPECIES: hypothetical protein [Pseudomonas]KPC11604.1 Uncharacterized protein AC500_5363 [Pseudomonas amygdali pv. lachrymans]AAO56009.1 protein of unknown function [Pseudomonas syringae pv. tomato str. DC3000]AVB20705.1 hypothetical protein BKM03_16925 [Pseudomonas avellanae]AVI85225.1 hypothetical protein XJ28_16735 [Pseudomonas syringae pv. tomato]EEB57883.1 hypothetical protein PSPTOT1_3383 [Pseudomonas syringae pv. tomato T1]